jgi:hypothetical protein
VVVVMFVTGFKAAAAAAVAGLGDEGVWSDIFVPVCCGSDRSDEVVLCEGGGP